MTQMAQFESMVVAQDALNMKVSGKDWREKNLDWITAMHKETAELMESLNSDWWKKTNTADIKSSGNYVKWLTGNDEEFDLLNVKVEIVDIFHFFISFLMMHNPKGWAEQFAEVLLTPSEPHVFSTTGKQRLKLLQSSKDFMHSVYIADHGSFKLSMYMFKDLMDAAGMTFKDIYKLYTGKNVLNRVRQENGYKAGTYKKLWNGVEDNVVMVDTIQELTQQEVQDELFGILDRYYKKHVWEIA